MTERIILAVCILATAALVAIAVRAPAVAGPEACEAPYLVRRVIDGDTFEVEDPWGLRTRVR